MTDGRLPTISGRRLIRWLESLGYRVVRQKGSHIQLTCRTITGQHHITVPAHRQIAKGTLNDILNSVSRSHGKVKIDIINDLSKF